MAISTIFAKALLTLWDIFVAPVRLYKSNETQPDLRFKKRVVVIAVLSKYFV